MTAMAIEASSEMSFVSIWVFNCIRNVRIGPAAVYKSSVRVYEWVYMYMYVYA